MTQYNDETLKVHFNGGYAYTFDDERVNIVPCPLEYSGTAPLRHLLSVLNEHNDEIEVTWKNGKGNADERILTIVNGHRKTKLKGHIPNLNKFKMHADKKLEWHTLPDGFWDYVDLLESTASIIVTNFKLSSIHCSPGYFEAASEAQIFRCYHKLKLPDEYEFLIRYNVLKGMNDGPESIARTETDCYFKRRCRTIQA